MQNHKDQCYKRNKLLQGNKKHNIYQGIAKKARKNIITYWKDISSLKIFSLN